MGVVPTDAEVLLRSLERPEEFGVLLTRHGRDVERYLHRRIGPDLAEELLAETFVAAFKDRGRCRTSGGSALPWLYGIATNLLRRHRRTELRQLRAYARTGIDPAFEFEAESLNRVSASSDAGRLAAILADLAERPRDALLLYALAELSYEEIALALDVPVGTVRTWLHRARLTARVHLERLPTACEPEGS
jgi:RNA polymerase sigma factor (sigma-70 family)